MIGFVVGDVIKRRDGKPFPDGNRYAIVRMPDPSASSLFPRVWIEKGQWADPADVQLVKQYDIANAAVKWSAVPVPDAPKVDEEDWQARYKEELVRRRRLEHKAAKANDKIEPMRQELTKLKKAEARRGRQIIYGMVQAERDHLNSQKISLIKHILMDEDFEL